MNAPMRSPRGTTISSRQLREAPARALRATIEGPVTITGAGGKPAYVLISQQAYQRLANRTLSAWELLAPQEPIAPDFDEHLPERRIESLFEFDKQKG